MEQNKYQDAVIYTIKTDTGLYVGSTCDFAQRKRSHKFNCFNENEKDYNFKVYQNIRENGGEYSIEIYKMFPCNSREELHIEEEKIMKELNANLNTKSAFMTEEQKINYKKEWKNNNRDKLRNYDKKYRMEQKEKYKQKDHEYYQKNKEKIQKRKAEKITCECGLDITRASISAHRKTKNHLNRMNLPESV